MGSIHDAKDINAVEASLEIPANVNYPQRPIYVGPQAPCRFEAEIYHCEIRGKIPESIDGTFYRNMPDQTWAPKMPNDVYFNGDGVIDAFRFYKGNVDFKQRFVRTPRFNIERAARKSVFGNFYNKFSDDPKVERELRHTSNTHVMYFNKLLLALGEDGPPTAMDPNTMETKGPFTFNGQFKAPRHSTHPKIDPVTGELMTYGTEAKGNGTKDIAYYRFDKNGKMLDEYWFVAPFAGMAHDLAFTENYVIIVLTPLVVNSDEDQKAGALHFKWDDNKNLTFGLWPRKNPKPGDAKWFHYKNVYVTHLGNAYEEGGKILCDMPLASGNRLFYFSDPKSKDVVKPNVVSRSHYARFTFDPKAKDLYVEPTPLTKDFSCEFPTLDPRYPGKKYRYAYLAATAPVDSDTAPRGAMGGLQNAIAICDLEKGTHEMWCSGNDTIMHEASFCPRSKDAPEGDGYLISIVNRHDRMLSSLVILDTKELKKGPVAIVNLPFRLRTGTHGSWVDQSDIGDRRDLVDMSGCSKELRMKYGPQYL